jgi:hypothetical protein
MKDIKSGSRVCFSMTRYQKAADSIEAHQPG